ncbi:hypothetical protein [Simkania negevensis]|uniref:Septum formation initiator n=1 Tax=Simkania negevensis (strain ATCC VR-1471 / DSM 27360 / Z) TaxID=331113 RepID=F8L915_SIMNZ|nr:hypothetical protein [Simkania negevensis]CCB89326.1 hypothetical protein SNE_A14490 [Simkania negevensis Z]
MLKARESKGKILSFFLTNWWIGAFILMAIALYAQALYQKNQLASLLQKKAELLKKEKELAIRDQEQLKLRIKSEEDPEWALLVLKQRLGVVEEGETKVIFKKRSQ